MKLFSIQILVTDSKRWGDHSGLRPTQTWRGGFIIASPNGGGDGQLGRQACCSFCSEWTLAFQGGLRISVELS